MDRRVCSCRKWELTRIPCKLIVAAIHNMTKNEMGAGKAARVKVVQDKLLVQGMSLVKLLVLVNRVKLQDKLLVQGMPQVKLVVLVNIKKDQDKVLVQGMPQVKLLVLVNLVHHQVMQAEDQFNVVQDQLKQVRDLVKVFKHQDHLQVLDHKDL
uniref:Zinc finger PMZ-type domain-containing protein n=1 Tax=Tanacetum cinerariifolium TaxID=118510 RepID=A0A699GRJ4_TANCI|nr:hypothetical protein [Tanacetum cinerariifolium]